MKRWQPDCGAVIALISSRDVVARRRSFLLHSFSEAEFGHDGMTLRSRSDALESGRRCRRSGPPMMRAGSDHGERHRAGDPLTRSMRAFRDRLRRT